MVPSLTRRGAATRLLAACLGLSLTLAACESDIDILTPTADAVDPMFARYVALGNSITAGFQSGGINDSTQREAYPVLLARQMQTPFAIPVLAGPGCEPPIVNIQTGARVGGSTAAGQCLLRVADSVSRTLNNVAVPGALALDPYSATSPSANLLTTLILGGRSQVQRALEQQPTFASLWIGNNDVLQAAATGLLTPTPGVSRGVTLVAEFTEQFNRTVDSLIAGAPALEGVLIGVVNVTAAPVLFPASALFNPGFRAGFDQFAGQAITLLPSCTPTTTSLISFAILQQIRSGSHPPVIGCTRNSLPGTPIGDIFVLDTDELASLSATVAAFNGAIEAKAAAEGLAYWDPNPALLQLRAGGQVPAVPNLASATQPFGEYISLDGVHPAGPTHVLIANGLIQAINAHYGTTLPLLPPP